MTSSSIWGTREWTVLRHVVSLSRSAERPLSLWDGRRGMGRVAETEDATDLKSGDPMGHVGATPTAATTIPT